MPAAVVWLSYGVSSSYVLADAIDKGKKAGDVSMSLPLIPPNSPCGSDHSLACGSLLWDSPVPHSLTWYSSCPCAVDGWGILPPALHVT